MEKGSRNIIITLLSIIVIVVLIICYFLFFGKNEVVDDKSPRVNIYKYEISSDNYKYYVKKLDANKIRLKDTITYKCEDSNCTYATSLLAESNIFKDNILINDNNKLIIYNFKKNKKKEIDNISSFIYADYIDDGKYILIKTSNGYYSYNVEKDKLSNIFKADLIKLKDKTIKTVLSNGLITIDNGKYGIINLNTGNNIYDNVYDDIDCNKNICLFSTDGRTNIYSNDSDNALIQGAEEILYYDDSYVLYKKGTEINLYEIENGNTTPVTISSNNCNNYIVSSDSKGTITCNKDKFKTDIFVTSVNKSNFTVKYNSNESYDLRTDINKLYNNIGEYYDYLSIDSDYDDSIKTNSNINIDRSNSYTTLKEISDELGLYDFERMEFISRWLPLLNRYSNSILKIKTSNKNDNIMDINILTTSNSYRNLTMFIEKGTSSKSVTVKDLGLTKLDRNESSILTISGINY